MLLRLLGHVLPAMLTLFESLLTKCNNDDKMKYKKQRFKLYNVRVQNIFKTFLGTISSILFIERQCHEDVGSGNQYNQ